MSASSVLEHISHYDSRGNLAQTHLVADEHAPDPIYRTVQVDDQLNARHLRLHPMRERHELYRFMKLERFARLGELARLHAVEREHVVEHLPLEDVACGSGGSPPSPSWLDCP